MKKLDWPRFSGQKPTYTVFRRDWKMCIGNLSEHPQIRKIRSKVPITIEPEIKNCSMMTQVWKVLDQEYGRPEDISREAINGLMQMQLNANTDVMKFL